VHPQDIVLSEAILHRNIYLETRVSGRGLNARYVSLIKGGDLGAAVPKLSTTCSAHTHDVFQERPASSRQDRSIIAGGACEYSQQCSHGDLDLHICSASVNDTICATDSLQ
jgi:hypothetical protein